MTLLKLVERSWEEKTINNRNLQTNRLEDAQANQRMCEVEPTTSTIETTVSVKY